MTNVKTIFLKSSQIFLVLIASPLFTLLGTTIVFAAAIFITGAAQIVNTNGNLDFDHYESNVAVDNVTGEFTGYAWLDDLGWVAFGADDNAEGPVVMDTNTGSISGKARVIATGAYLDFSNYESNVTVELATGLLSGYVWSEDLGWINFDFSTVSTGVPLVTATPTPTLAVDRTAPVEVFTVKDNAGKVYTKTFEPTTLDNLNVVGDAHYPLFCFTKGYDADVGLASYKIIVDEKEYISNIPYNQPPVGDNGDTRQEGDSLIKEDNYWYINYHQYNDVSQQQQVCVQGKAQSHYLEKGLHYWFVTAVDKAGNSTSFAKKRFLVMTNQASFNPKLSGVWFPLTFSQVGNKTNLTAYTTINSALFSSQIKPVLFTDSTPTFYGIAEVGAKVTLKLVKNELNEGVGETSDVEITQTTFSNHSSEWGINLTEPIAEGNYLLTIQAENDSNHFAVLKDIPIKLISNPPKTNAVLGQQVPTIEPTHSENTPPETTIDQKRFCILKWCW